MTTVDPARAPPGHAQGPTTYGEPTLASLQATARAGGNLFAELLRTVCSCSLGEITHALYEVGGQYRRSM